MAGGIPGDKRYRGQHHPLFYNVPLIATVLALMLGLIFLLSLRTSLAQGQITSGINGQEGQYQFLNSDTSNALTVGLHRDAPVVAQDYAVQGFVYHYELSGDSSGFADPNQDSYFYLLPNSEMYLYSITPGIHHELRLTAGGLIVLGGGFTNPVQVTFSGDKNLAFFTNGCMVVQFDSTLSRYSATCFEGQCWYSDNAELHLEDTNGDGTQTPSLQAGQSAGFPLDANSRHDIDRIVELEQAEPPDFTHYDRLFWPSTLWRSAHRYDCGAAPQQRPPSPTPQPTVALSVNQQNVQVVNANPRYGPSMPPPALPTQAGTPTARNPDDSGEGQGPGNGGNPPAQETPSDPGTAVNSPASPTNPPPPPVTAIPSPLPPTATLHPSCDNPGNNPNCPDDPDDPSDPSGPEGPGPDCTRAPNSQPCRAPSDDPKPPGPDCSRSPNAAHCRTPDNP